MTVAIDASLGNMDGIGLLNIGWDPCSRGRSQQTPATGGDLYIMASSMSAVLYTSCKTQDPLVTKWQLSSVKGCWQLVNTRAGLR